MAKKRHLSYTIVNNSSTSTTIEVPAMYTANGDMAQPPPVKLAPTQGAVYYIDTNTLEIVDKTGKSDVTE